MMLDYGSLGMTTKLSGEIVSQDNKPAKVPANVAENHLAKKIASGKMGKPLSVVEQSFRAT